ncbi:hypothetical protein NLJ89_g5103 [Agrocybe chaxingu]|uniref:Uncharacterized protein n=1 Tax=Agrocybe chaxingu TaxID=84603 RepID=A0A9W8MVB9_9AGAR|nr:hypothetical protein NLJ89_g5103 [Agrocybe chaxingu]
MDYYLLPYRGITAFFLKFPSIMVFFNAYRPYGRHLPATKPCPRKKAAAPITWNNNPSRLARIMKRGTFVMSDWSKDSNVATYQGYDAVPQGSVLFGNDPIGPPDPSTYNLALSPARYVPKKLRNDSYFYSTPDVPQDSLLFQVGPSGGTLNIPIHPRTSEGKPSFLDWNNVRRLAAAFYERQVGARNNMLDVNWEGNLVDRDGWRGRYVLKELFCYLNANYVSDGRQAYPLTASFTCMHLTVPETVRDLATRDPLGNLAEESDCVDLQYASKLEELRWKGDFALFVSKFINVPFHQLSTLAVTGCVLSTNDAVAILHSCPVLTRAELATVDSVAASNHNVALKPSAFYSQDMRRLTDLKLISNDPVNPIFIRLTFDTLHTLTIDFRDGVEIVGALDRLKSSVNLVLIGHIPVSQRNGLTRRFSNVQFVSN